MTLKKLFILASGLVGYCGSLSVAAPSIHSDITIPEVLPSWSVNETPLLDKKPVYIVPAIQTRLKTFLQRRADPVAAVMIADVHTGQILAMVQGADPASWGGEVNTNLHAHFPAASLFKTVVAAATLETLDFDTSEKDVLDGGCGTVSPKGHWMRNDLKGRRRFRINLRRAYGSSCNGYFARLAVNEVGLGPIISMSKTLGWNGNPIPADFLIPASPIRPPDPSTSSAHMVGRFAAGFGYVGLSVAHATWQMMTIANSGYAKPLLLFQGSEGNQPLQPRPYPQLFSEETAEDLKSIMDATVLGGTATSSFRKRSYRNFRVKMGGKTGTLTGSNPRGVTTWFAGLYPIQNPEIAVVSVVVLKDLWHVKATDLAAEAVKAYIDNDKFSKLATTKKP